MDTADQEQRRRRMTWALDLGLPAGLLLVLLVVLAIDKRISGNIAAKDATVDVVFVLDQGRAMAGVVDAMKANCLEKAAGLQAGGLDCRFAVIPFGRGANEIPAIPLTSELPVFQQRLQETPAASDAPPTGSNTEALEQALRLDFRPDASVFFFLITNTPNQQAEELAGIADRMKQRRIKAIIQANAAEQDAYRPLYQGGGRFFTMEGEDVTGPVAASSEGNPADSRAASLLASLTVQSRSSDPSALMGAKGLYGLRTVQNREKWIARLGGSPQSELAVTEGLAWLARHQADDGHWSDEGKCEVEQKCRSLNCRAAVAETGLAILAFQAGGHYYFNEQKYSAHVTRGLDWLVQQQKEDGRLFGRKATWYEHGIATFALAEACAVSIAEGTTPNERYLDAARRAVAFTGEHQYARGGWQYALDSRGMGDTSVTGWQVLSLKSALEAEISVAPETLERIQTFYEACGNPSTGQTGYQSRSRGTDLTTAVGLIVQEFIFKQPNSPLAQKAIEFLAGRAGQGIGSSGDFYTLYNATLAMFLAGGEPWQRWNSQVRDAVVQRQEKEGCARGSWNDRYQRTLDTAWAVLTLEVYYRYATEN